MLSLFLMGKPRYDIVAIFGLITATVFGIVPADEAFRGFAHPAVVTVAAVLIVSRGLFNAGAVDIISNQLEKVGNNLMIQTLAITALVAICSAFMNNVGALALLMPVAIEMARKNDRPPSMLLMPLAFGSLLGGLITLIGTPPNIIVSGFRENVGATPFRMFDFAWVGVPLAAAGIFFITLFSRYLVPRREQQTTREDIFQIHEYTTEVRIPEGNPLIGNTLKEFRQQKETDVVIVGIIRNNRRILAPKRFERIRPEDTLIIEADTEEMQKFLARNELLLEGSRKVGEKDIDSDEVAISETVVMSDSPLVGKNVKEINLRWRYGVNLLAVARKGQRIEERLTEIDFRPGDVLLIQAEASTMHDTFEQLNLVLISDRKINLGKKRGLLGALAIFAGAISLAVFDLMRIEIALTAAAGTMALFRVVKLRELYQSVDWPVVVLLGSVIPVAEAMEPTGTAELISNGLLHLGDQTAPWIVVAVLLITTLLLANLVNNASAVLMAPIALNMADVLEVSADPLLMTVAIGASLTFLTPIGHQSNTIVMGPGGYQFKDYWKLGLPLSILLVAISVPLILWFWPL